MLPLPFSMVKLAYGDPIYVPENVNKKTILEYTKTVEAELNQLTQYVDRLCGYDPGV